MGAGTIDLGVVLVRAAAATMLVGAIAVHLVRWRGGSTDRRLLEPAALRRLVRLVRSLTLRVGSALSAWPHALLRLGGIDPIGSMATAGPSWVLDPGGPTLSAPGWDGRAAAAPPILLVHALVTRPWILDLTPATSLVGALGRAGRTVFVLDWGDPRPSDRARSLEWAARWIAAAEVEVCALTGADRVHVVGYCSGGTVALLRAAVLPRPRLASVSCIATPIDASIGGMPALLAHPDLAPALFLDHRGLVPAAVVREAFHWLRPRALRSVVTRLRAGRRTPMAEIDALSAWLWRQRDLPGGILFDLVELSRTNGLLSGDLVMAGRRVDLGAIPVPVARFRAGHDHIVPDADRGLPGWHEIECAGGHIGMLLGVRGAPSLHDLLPAWLGNVDALPTAVAEARVA